MLIHRTIFVVFLFSLHVSWTTSLSTNVPSDVKNIVEENRMVVAVVGATGRLGREVVRQLSDRGYSCRILVRPHSLQHQQQQHQKDKQQKSQVSSSSSKNKNLDLDSLISLPGISAIIPGDVTDPDSLSTLLQGCSACFAVYGATRRSRIQDLWTNPSENDPMHAKSVNYQGIANLLDVIRNQSPRTCQRIIRITGNGETPYSFFSILINLLGSMAKAWNYEGEQLLRRQNDVDYTIIRPGVMSESPSPLGSKLILSDNGGKLPTSPISYTDIAALCIDCLEHPTTTARCTLTAMTTSDSMISSSSSSTTWSPLLENLQADQRIFPTDMLDQHQKAIRRTIFGIGTILIGVILSAIVNLVSF
jgi:nucleoside-diphosphate-sugar epimerase